MGLTSGSTGKRAVDSGFVIERGPGERVIALAGNPNVGKSTVFNELTGLNQHTGNWPGKTVTNAQGRYTHKGREYIMVDIPGTYSLMAHSVEEEVARDFICSLRRIFPVVNRSMTRATRPSGTRFKGIISWFMVSSPNLSEFRGLCGLPPISLFSSMWERS